MSANFQLFGLSESSAILGLMSIALLLSNVACNHIQSYTLDDSYMYARSQEQIVEHC